MKIRFAAIGMDHYHIYNQVDCLLPAGADLISFFSDQPQQVREFGKKYPQASLARSVDEILEDGSIDLITSASIPDRRADLGLRVMAHGKDYLCAKPAFTTLDQLTAGRQAQAATGRKYIVYFGERFGNAATVKALELAQAGAIGHVIQTTGFGPHRLFGHTSRPEWTFQRPRYGGILNDLASHQIDQFMAFTGSTTAQIVTAHTANLNHPQYPGFEDFGELLLRGDGSTGYIRVDWFTPAGLPTWGDVRLFVLGTAGYMEIRKYCDLNGRAGGDHLFLVDGQEIHYLDCENVQTPFGDQLIHDLQTREETAVSQAHTFTVSELALQAQMLSRQLSAV